jgi:hypothetical protein
MLAALTGVGNLFNTTHSGLNCKHLSSIQRQVMASMGLGAQRQLEDGDLHPALKSHT